MLPSAPCRCSGQAFAAVVLVATLGFNGCCFAVAPGGASGDFDVLKSDVGVGEAHLRYATSRSPLATSLAVGSSEDLVADKFCLVVGGAKVKFFFCLVSALTLLFK